MKFTYSVHATRADGELGERLRPATAEEHAAWCNNQRNGDMEGIWTDGGELVQVRKDRVDDPWHPMNAATECECSEDYGPCEDHCTVLVQREGSSTRTADDLLYVYLCDMVDVIADQTGDENVLSPWGEDVLGRAGALLDQNDHYGCRWLPEVEGEQMRDEMTTLQYQLEASVSTLDQTIWTTWDDGFWIVQVHEDCPLLDA